VLSDHGLPGWDYVLVGRPGATVSRDFASMIADLERALARLHGQAAQSPRPEPSKSPAR
jgi:ribonuclease P protein component